VSPRRSAFDARWRELAHRARGPAQAGPQAAPRAAPQAAPQAALQAAPQASPPRSLDHLARLARAREPQAVPFLAPRTTWRLAAVAALFTAYFAPLVFSSDDALAQLEVAKPPNLPPPPRLPPPPTLEAPAFYLAKAGAALKELP
jgi:hypothetical protein